MKPIRYLFHTEKQFATFCRERFYDDVILRHQRKFYSVFNKIKVIVVAVFL